MIRQRKPLQRTSWLTRSQTPIARSPMKRSATRPTRAPKTLRQKPVKKLNVAATKRRLAKYQAFMRSPEWKAIRRAAIERAGYRCEHQEIVRVEGKLSLVRCPATTYLQAHHLRYTRFGGKELPRDLKVLCDPHHELAEAQKGGTPLWKRASVA